MRKAMLWSVLPLLALMSLPLGMPSAARAHAARGASVPPMLWLSSYSGKPEQMFGFAGNGFQPREQVQLRLESEGATPATQTNLLLASATANAGGNLAGQATVPFLPAGNYPLLVMGPDDESILTLHFVVLGFSPWVELDNYAPFPHVLLGFSGEDFAPGESVLVYLDDAVSLPILQVQVGGTGAFEMKKAVESPEQPGKHTLIFIGGRSGVAARVAFLVEPQPLKPQPIAARDGGGTSGAFACAAGLRAGPALRTSGRLPSSAASALAERLAARDGGTTNSALGDFSLQDPLTLALVVLGGWVTLCLLLVLPLLVSPLLQRRRRNWQAEDSAGVTGQAARVQVGAETLLPARTAIGPAAAPSVLLPDLLQDRQPAFQPIQPALPAVSDARQSQRGNNPLRLPSSQRQPGIEVSSTSELGCLHANRENEDHFLAVTGARKVAGALQSFGLFVVADGISGHATGAAASRTAIETVYQLFVPQLICEELAGEDMLALLAATIRYTNTLLYRQSLQQRQQLGCTVTAALVAGQEVSLCHVGKNRVYLLPAQAPLRRVTIDHSLVEGLAVAGLIKREDVYTHPMRNRIYRCLGHRPQVDVDTFRLPAAPGDQYLLCSDGLWQALRDPVIEAVLRRSTDVDQANKTLVSLVNEQGGPDNATAILIKLTDEPRPALRPGIGRVNANLRLRQTQETRGMLLSSL